MKRLRVTLAGILSAAMLLSLAACGGDSGSSTQPTPAGGASAPPSASQPSTPPAQESTPADAGGDKGDAAPVDGKLQGPFIVTSCGQSPGAVMINMVAVQAGLTSTNDNSLSAENFDAGDAKTLIVTTGTSGKGMGAAGTDVDTEITRCEALIQAAKDAGLTICCAHVEGMARRTDNADQKSIDSIMALADVVLVIEESDSDSLFTDYTTEHDIPLLKVKDALEIGTVMQ